MPFKLTIYMVELVAASLVLALSFLFQSFIVGYYSYGTFIGISVGSIVIAFVINYLKIKTNTLIGSIIMIFEGFVLINLFPIKYIRDFSDSIMPYINVLVRALIYLVISNVIRLLFLFRRR